MPAVEKGQAGVTGRLQICGGVCEKSNRHRLDQDQNPPDHAAISDLILRGFLSSCLSRSAVANPLGLVLSSLAPPTVFRFRRPTFSTGSSQHVARLLRVSARERGLEQVNPLST
jgi:hypothetical protein